MKLSSISKGLETLRTLFSDPEENLARQTARIVRVLRRTQLIELFGPAEMGRAVGRMIRRGISARTALSLRAAAHPDRLALRDLERTLTYAQTDEEINRLSNGLAQRFGVGRGAAAVLLMENRAEYVIGWLALFRLGARAAHASYRSTAQELSYLLHHSGARVVLASTSCWPTIEKLRESEPDLDFDVVLVGTEIPQQATVVAYRSLVAGAPATFPPTRLGEAHRSENIVYTSGTTGRPKGAVRDFASLGMLDLLKLLDSLPFRSSDHHLVVCPLYHSGAQAFTLMQLAMGASVHLVPHFEPEETWRALSEWRIHSAFMVPTMIRRLVEIPEDVRGNHPLRDLRAIVSGAASFPHSLRVEASRVFGPEKIFDFYGATELGWVTLISGPEMLARPGSVGRPSPGQEIQILGDHGQPLGPGEVGCIYTRSRQLMSGYFNDANATNAAERSGWLTVEDLGYLDADGYLYLSGRARDMVISGGVNIYPAEIEEVLARHRDVREVAVIGLPDPEWGERLVGVIAPRSESFEVADLERFAREELAAYKVPKAWVTLDQLPRNPTGKVLKRDLREQLAQEDIGVP